MAAKLAGRIIWNESVVGGPQDSFAVQMMRVFKIHMLILKEPPNFVKGFEEATGFDLDVRENRF